MSDDHIATDTLSPVFGADGVDGVGVARKVRETDFDVRIVFCTTSNEFASESYVEFLIE